MDARDPLNLRNLVREAIGCLRSRGREETLARISDPRGPFIQCGNCVFALDMNGNLLAHPFCTESLGKNLADLRDFDGRTFILKLLKTARCRGYGFVEYTWLDADSGVLIRRMIFFEQSEGIVFCSEICTEKNDPIEAVGEHSLFDGPENSGRPS